MTTADKLITVAENVPKVYHAGQMNVVENAECLKGSKTDTAILLDDVSPVTHNMGVKVRRNNLIPYPYRDTTKTGNGITFTDNGDGSITITGTATANAYFALCTIDFGDKPINAISVDYATNGIYTASKRIYYNQNTKSTDITILSGSTVDETIYPQIELGTTATAYTPYIPDLTAVKVKKQGKNLIPYPYMYSTITNNGITYTDNGNGTITISGKLISSLSNMSLASNILLKAGTYTLCGHPTTTDNKNIYMFAPIYASDGSVTYWSDYGSGSTKTFTEDVTVSVTIRVKTEGTVVDNVVLRPQIELGSTATDYEPYITPTEYTPNTEGIVNGVTSLYPNTTLTTDTDGVIIDCEYYKDIDKAYNKLSAAIALSGGE